MSTVHTVNVTDVDAAGQLVELIGDDTMAQAIDKALTQYRDLYATRVKADSFSPENAAMELWQNSGDETINLYNEIKAKIDKYTEQLEEIKSEAIAEYLERVSEDTGVNQGEARKNHNAAAKGVRSILQFAFGVNASDMKNDVIALPNGDSVSLTGLAAKGSSSNPADAERLARVRTWARDHGFDVSDRGRISANVQEAYAKANPDDA